MNDGRLWSALRKSWLLILISVVLGLAISVIYLWAAPTKYTAQADLYVSTVGGLTVSELSAGTTAAQAQARNLAMIATSDRVLEPVARQLRLNRSGVDLSGAVSASVPANTSVIQLEVTDSSNQDAARLANAVASSLVNATGDLLPPSRRGAPAITVQVVQTAVVPTEPSSPNLNVSVLMGLALGLLVGAAVAVIRDAKSTTSDRGRPEGHQAGSDQRPDVAQRVTDQNPESQWTWAPDRS